MKFRRSSASSSFIDSGASIIGDLQFSGELRIDGDLHGSITTSDILIVGKMATVQADIRAGEVQIHGKVLGNIDCEKRVEICEGGSLQGDVRTLQLLIHDGATFEGLSRPATEPTLNEPSSELVQPDEVGLERSEINT